MNNYIQNSIEATKNSFENSFKEATFYNKQTINDKHLEMILDTLKINPGDKILDLGTGSGYLAFELAKKFPNSKIIGLDIIENTLKENIKKAEKESINNIEFISYDGINLPFKDNEFDYIVTRYALHHFPLIESTFTEISRILKKDSYLFISDPTPNENDDKRFVDDYMKMKKDGHIKYYTKEEFIELGFKNNLELTGEFKSQITFPRLKDTSVEFEKIIKLHDDDVINSYNVKISDNNEYLYITQKVLNLTFIKRD